MTDTALAAFLASNPAMTVRDFKGKGFTTFAPFDRNHVEPGEPAWHQLDPKAVREAATTEKARFLTKGERQAAARDPLLEWDERARQYRLRGRQP